MDFKEAFQATLASCVSFLVKPFLKVLFPLFGFLDSA